MKLRMVVGFCLALIVIIHGADEASLDRLISHRLEAKKA
jgi:hypothetical protein